MKKFMAEIRASIIVTVTLGIILCGLYPLVIWGVGNILFPQKAAGSLIEIGGKIVGSSLIAQGFAGEKYFHPRPSSAGPGYDGTSSGGSNLGPLSRKLVDTVGQRAADYRKENGLAPDRSLPADAVTASASGLDPHISPANALIQVSRIAKARELSVEEVRRRVERHTEGRDLGLLGEPRVNVLRLNLDLDGVLRK